MEAILRGMHINILTIFPEMFPGSLGQALAGKALEKGLWSYSVTNPRDFAPGVHQAVDDTPYGGGAGMVMRADVLGDAIDSIPNRGRFLYPSPRGRVLNQAYVRELSRESTLTFLCGRYEGIDQRIIDHYNIEEISIGDYILSGGEVAVHVLIDSVLRLIPGVLGNQDTHEDESFSNGLLEYPHYTKPASWRGMEVPDVLRSGHHANIESWRFEQSMMLTKQRRADLLEK